MSALVLIVDADPIQRRLSTAAVERLGHRAVPVTDGGEALVRLARPGGDRVALVVLDLALPGEDGMAALAELRARHAAIPVIVSAARGSADAVRAAIRAGAADFIIPPVGAERLEVSVGNALRLAALEGELARMKRGFDAAGRLPAVDAGGELRPLAEIEAAAIRLAFDRYSGRAALVARHLGIGRSTLYRKLRDLGLAA